LSTASCTDAEIKKYWDDYDLSWDEAWEITCKTCAYTNHTIMSEALEKWPIELFSRLLPRIYQIVEPGQIIVIHQDTHQLCYCNGRMGII